MRCTGVLDHVVDFVDEGWVLLYAIFDFRISPARFELVKFKVDFEGLVVSSNRGLGVF